MRPVGAFGRHHAVNPAPTATAVYVFGIVLLAVIDSGSLPARATVTIGPGVVFQPSGSWANLSFASNQTFSAIHVDATGVRFDTVRFGIQKLPARLPRTVLNVTTWAPLQSVVNSTSISFAGMAPTGSTVFYNFSGLLTSRQYVFKVDGLVRASRFTDAGGNFSFPWSAWSPHPFEILLGWLIGSPTPLSADFAFVPSNPHAGEVVTFSAAAAGGTSPYTFNWQLGDTSTGTGASVTHAYVGAGTFTANLTAADSDGQIWTESHGVVVLSGPAPTNLTANFTFAPLDPVAGEAVAFTSAAARGSPPYTYAWDFGDGSTGSGASPNHAYGTQGSYTVTLRVSDSMGTIFTIKKALYVRNAAPPGGRPSLPLLLVILPLLVTILVVGVLAIALAKRRRKEVREEREGKQQRRRRKRP